MGRDVGPSKGRGAIGVNRLALGTAQFGSDYGIANTVGRIPDADAAALLAHAWRAGVRTLDTAIAYGDSEARLGALGVGDWRVISKLPAMPADVDAVRWVADAVDGSLGRLQRRSLSALLLHRPQQLLEPAGESLYEGLRQVKAAGLVEKIGVSIYDPAELDALTSRFTFDIIQAPFSVIDRRLAESGWLARLAAAGAEVHVRSVFLQGLLLMPINARPEKFARWSSVWSRWDQWLHAAGISPVDACLRYALSVPEVDCAVVGVDSVGQLDEILRAAGGSMPPLPADLRSSDPDLVNPSRWMSL